MHMPPGQYWIVTPKPAVGSLTETSNFFFPLTNASILIRLTPNLTLAGFALATFAEPKSMSTKTSLFDVKFDVNFTVWLRTTFHGMVVGTSRTGGGGELIPFTVIDTAWNVLAKMVPPPFRDLGIRKSLSIKNDGIRNFLRKLPVSLTSMGAGSANP